MFKAVQREFSEPSCHTSPLGGVGLTGGSLWLALSLLCSLCPHSLCSATDGNSSDSDPDAGTTELTLQPRARRFLPDQFSKASPAYKVEWKNEVAAGPARAQPATPLAPRSRDGGTQTPGVLRQPLLARDPRCGRPREDSVAEDVPPKPPPRLVRRASEPGNRKGRPGPEKP